MWEIMKEFLTPAIVIPVATTIIAAIWGGYVYWESRKAKTLEIERLAWKELADFHRLTLETLLAGVMVRGQHSAERSDQFRRKHEDWYRMLTAKRGQLGPKGRKRALRLTDKFASVSRHLQGLNELIGRPESEVPTEWQLMDLHKAVTKEATYFIW